MQKIDNKSGIRQIDKYMLGVSDSANIEDTTGQLINNKWKNKKNKNKDEVYLIVNKICECPKDLFKEKIDSLYDKIEQLFVSGYENNYSDAYYVLFKMGLNPEKFHTLSERLDEMYYCFPLDRYEKHKKEMKKFLSYFLLEITRFVQNRDDRKSISEIENIISDVTKLKDEYSKSQEKSINIFSIFSAVILTFSGGFSFTTSIISGLSDVSSYRVVFIAALIGFVLFNTIFMLLFIISKLTGASIRTRCVNAGEKIGDNNSLSVCSNHTCKLNHEPNCLCRIVHGYPYILFVNIILFSIMIIDFGMWVYFANGLNLERNLLNNIYKWTGIVICSICLITGFVYMIYKKHIKYKSNKKIKFTPPQQLT